MAGFSARSTRSGSSARLALPGLLLLGGALLAMPADADGGRDRSNIGPAIKKVQDQPRYASARWGLLAVDLDTGRTVMQQAPDDFFGIGSTQKLFTIAGAFQDIDPEHRFETRVVRTGEVDANGVLAGDLILIATGDLTMGGRRNPGGTVAYTDFDHADANPLGGAILTTPDPLAGIDDVAQQIAAAGIKQVHGDVVIDDRLYQTTPHRDFILTPIMINDNLIDLTIEPQSPGAVAPVEWRPHTAAFEVKSEVVTVEDGGVTDIEIDGDIAGGVTTILLTGTIAADADNNPLGFQPVRTWQVENPAAFARTLLIEALGRAGVTVDAPVLGDNASADLPDSDAVANLPQVAVLTSAPYREQTKLILKVSHNLGADTATMLLAVANGERSREAGMAILGELLEEMFGIGKDRWAAFDGSGLTSLSTPTALVSLLRQMAMREDAEAYAHGLPIMGVDGSLAPVQADSPAAGHVFAKTGTSAIFDAAHGGAFLTEKALAGYIDARNGRRLAFAVMVANTLVDGIEDIAAVNQDLGEIAAILWAGRR